MRTELGALRFIERGPKHDSMFGKSLVLRYCCVVVLMIVMEPLFDHRRAGRRSNFSHVVVVYVHRDRTCCQNLGFDCSMAALRQLAHYIRANVFVRYLLLTI